MGGAAKRFDLQVRWLERGGVLWFAEGAARRGATCWSEKTAPFVQAKDGGELGVKTSRSGSRPSRAGGAARGADGAPR